MLYQVNKDLFLNELSIKVYSLEILTVVGDAPESITVVNNIVNVEHMAPNLQDILETIAKGHAGNIIPEIKHYSTVGLVQTETIVTQTSEWQDLGGVVGDFTFFSPSMLGMMGKITGQCKTSGDMPEVRLVENTDTEERVLTLDPLNVPNTNGEWQKIDYNTSNALVGGFNTYHLQGRLNNCKSCSFRFVSLTLFKLSF